MRGRQKLPHPSDDGMRPVLRSKKGKRERYTDLSDLRLFSARRQLLRGYDKVQFVRHLIGFEL
jgi:hypothetical protein